MLSSIHNSIFLFRAESPSLERQTSAALVYKSYPELFSLRLQEPLVQGTLLLLDAEIRIGYKIATRQNWSEDEQDKSMCIFITIERHVKGVRRSPSRADLDPLKIPAL